jgi:hypothetical protein
MQINGSVTTGYPALQAGGGTGGTGASGAEETKDYGKLLEEKRSELWTKIMNGETQATYQIGGQSFTEKEWERLLKRVDTEIETEDREDDSGEEKSPVDTLANLVAEITDKEQFLGQQQSKVEQRAEELKKIKKGIYEMQAMLDGQQMETIIEDQEKQDEKRAEEKKQTKKETAGAESGDEKTAGREEIMEMMMAGAKRII